MDIVKKLLCVRKSLELIQTEMGQGILSESCLSKVKRGIHEITANDLVKMLELNGISVMEFLKDKSNNKGD